MIVLKSQLEQKQNGADFETIQKCGVNNYHRTLTSTQYIAL